MTLVHESLALAPTGLQDLQTPCLLLDETKMSRNLARLDAQLRKFDVSFRPHLKTAKSIDIARRMMRTAAGPATVSTLAEAEAFADAGVTDILYAVGVSPAKLPRIISLRRRGANLSIILDSIEQAVEVAKASREAGMPLPTLIEIDSDGHRAGVKPDDAQLLEIAAILEHQGARLMGVMTHAGGSYDLNGAAALERAAEQERLAALTAATRLRSAGYSCPVVSVGSTPTAHYARNLDGVTEVRAGVFVFFDLVMAGVGVCTVDDIALSVLASVNGVHRDSGRIFVDAGWMALSRDRGTASQAVDQGYGLVCNAAGRPFPDLIVSQANQEHGVLTLRPESQAKLPDLQVGSYLRILPNHACATAAQHSAYHIVGAGGAVDKVWPRISGW